MGCNCGKKKNDIRYFSTEDMKEFQRTRNVSVSKTVQAKKEAANRDKK